MDDMRGAKAHSCRPLCGLTPLLCVDSQHFISSLYSLTPTSHHLSCCSCVVTLPVVPSAGVALSVIAMGGGVHPTLDHHLFLSLSFSLMCPFHSPPFHDDRPPSL